MSTFAVFGMTEDYAKRAAERHLAKIPIEKKDYDERLEREALKMMNSKRSARLSDLFDSPQYAKEFIAPLKKSGIKYRDIRIRAGVKQEDKTKKTKLVWVDTW